MITDTQDNQGIDQDTQDMIKKALIMRALTGQQDQGYGKPLIGNEQTANLAQKAQGAFNTFFSGVPPQQPVAQDKSLMNILHAQNLMSEINKRNQPAPSYFTRDQNGNFIPVTGDGIRPGMKALPFSYSDANNEHIQAETEAEKAKTNETNNKIASEKLSNENSSQSIKDAAQQNLESIAEAKKGATRGGVKFFGPAADLPSTLAPSSFLGMGDYNDRSTWESNVNQLVSQKVVDLITKMKSASRTGATGFGQLSDKEGAILRQASTAFNKKLPPDKALYYLNEMEKINQKILGSGSNNSDNSGQVDYKSKYGLQ